MRPDLTFGPPGDEWHYDRPSRTYNLTRGRSPAWTVGTTQGPVETFISVAPHSTALVIVDMQNYFLHPSCRDHPAGLAAVGKTMRTIEKCRELGIQVRLPIPPVGVRGSTRQMLPPPSYRRVKVDGAR